jgi:glutamate/tyrosine decarboxylase-like PLP-dependent enzyme
MGYEVVDRIIDHIAALDGKPAMRVSSRDALEKRLREALPRTPSAFADVLDQLWRDVFTSIGHLNHPRFFGFIPTPSNWVGVLADAVASGITPFCGTWLEGSGPTEVELVTIDWLREACGLPASAGGLFVSGGSIANLTALAAARDHRSDDISRHVVYVSDQTHSSVDRALKILGYRTAQVRKVATDAMFRIELTELRRAVDADVASGQIPHAVVANAGTTNTGAIDPLHALADICRETGAWLHVDGAYGAAAVFSSRGRLLLDGLGRADSITLDPHKWLFQPYLLGCVIVRDPVHLLNFFRVLPEYLRDTETERGEVNLCDYGPELTRSFRALKLWMSMKVFGADAFGTAIDHGFACAEIAERLLRGDARWEILSPAQLGIVCFRYVKPGLSEVQLDDLNTEIARATAADGCCFVSTTVLRGRTCLRLCAIQPATSEEDLRRSVECLGAAGERLSG